jgi:alkanesulfonate monooxygenase SsuD/methylene tetrahydromethanopterin reductase-like flavin-dependent oxidoreductase (luciferase family)
MASQFGFDGVLISEGHGVASNVPNPLQFVGWLLDAMPTGWAAPCPLLLPLRSASVVAEEVGWLGVRYPGRVGVGVAVGGHRRQFEALGVDFDSRVERFGPQLHRLVEALSGAGDVEGDAALAECRQQPIPVVSAALSDGAVERAVAAGAGIVGDSLTSVARTVELLEHYRRFGGSGREVVIRRVWIGRPPREEARRQVDGYRAVASARQLTGWGAEDHTVVAASPPELAGRLSAVLQQTGPVALNLRVHVAGVAPEVIEEQIALVGTEVLPLLRQSVAGGTASGG